MIGDTEYKISSFRNNTIVGSPSGEEDPIAYKPNEQKHEHKFVRYQDGLSSKEIVNAQLAYFAKRDGLTNAKNVISIGRSSDDLRIPYKSISRKHCELALFEDGRISLRQISKKSPSFVNGKAIQEQRDIKLKTGDFITFPKPAPSAKYDIEILDEGFFTIGNRLYRNKKGSLILFSRDFAMLKELFPNGFKTVRLKQRNIGSCYLLASALGLARNKTIGPLILANAFEKIDEDKYLVKIPFNSTYKNDTYEITEEDMVSRLIPGTTNKFKHWAAGDKAFTLLDVANGRRRKAILADKRVELGDEAEFERLLNMDFEEYMNQPYKMNPKREDPGFNFEEYLDEEFADRTEAVAEGGFASSSLRTLTGAEVEVYSLEGDCKLSNLNQYLGLLAGNKENLVITVSTPPAKDKYLDPDKKLNKRHAFLLDQIIIDPVTRLPRLFLINPHDSKKTVEISSAELLTYCSSIVVADLRTVDTRKFIIKPSI